jgi:hypothetical protein
VPTTKPDFRNAADERLTVVVNYYNYIENPSLGIPGTGAGGIDSGN